MALSKHQTLLLCNTCFFRTSYCPVCVVNTLRLLGMVPSSVDDPIRTLITREPQLAFQNHKGKKNIGTYRHYKDLDTTWKAEWLLDL